MTYDDRERNLRDEPVAGEDDMRDDLELRRPTNMDDIPATTDDENQKFEGGEAAGAGAGALGGALVGGAVGAGAGAGAGDHAEDQIEDKSEQRDYQPTNR